MIKTITLVREDATETTLDTKPKEICLETKDGKLHLKLLWNALDLADDAEEYLAVKAVWPGKQSVRLTSGTDEELFKGKVSGFVQTKEDLGFHATQDSMVPGGLAVDVTEDTADATRMSVLITVDNFGEGGVSLDFGDGTPGGTNIGDGTTTTGHLFTAPGTYTVTATDVDQPDRTNTFEVTVPFTVGLGDLEVTIVADAGDPLRQRASVLADNKGAGEVSISWGDGLPDDTNPGDGVTNTEHNYAVGTFTLAVTDVDEPERTHSQPVTIPFPAEG